ncbi:MAG: heavy-metal-associated domain-containing protein [Candidatus Binatia bacterium]
MARIVNLTVVGENKRHCSGCERSVVATLEGLPGVRQVRANHRTQDVEVLLALGETSMDDIRAELAEIGYQVEAA